MSAFEDGYILFESNIGNYVGTGSSAEYIHRIELEINDLSDKLNHFKGFQTPADKLKGDVAEYFHAGSFNANAAANNSSNRAYVPKSTEYASADIVTNFFEKYGLKYYSSGEESAKKQALSYFETYKEYLSKSKNNISFEDYLRERNIDPDSVVSSDPIYTGQVRIIPKDQLEEAIKFLEHKIAKESATRPEQVERYKETLAMLSDKIKDNNGCESVPLSKEDAEKLAKLAKEGKIDEEVLKKYGVSTENLVTYQHIFNQAIKAGLTSALLSMAIRLGPEIYRAIVTLIENGELNEDDFKRMGFAALNGASEGFVRGTVSASITAACASGLWGESLKKIDPSIIGAATVIVMNTMMNSYKVVQGTMSHSELANDLIRDICVTGFSIPFGCIGQYVIGIPILGYVLGSFVGSIIGSFVYKAGLETVLSFCTYSGFTCFGLVEQNYEVPSEILQEIGINIFEFSEAIYSDFQYASSSFASNNYLSNSYIGTNDILGITILRRGVIGINKIGYIF